jgi:uncharacterized membrane protein YdjX (TVP38/TMEM64 family)
VRLDHVALRHYWLVAGGLVLLLLLLFVAGDAAGLSMLVDPTPSSGTDARVAGTVGIVLLLSDVVLPVPSSVVMVLHGARFGLWVGTLLSLTGSAGASLVGFGLGRAGHSVLRRLVTPAEHQRAGALLQRWGALAIVVTRPVPLLAETVAILAGASPLRWSRAAIAILVGTFPAAFLYALAGTAAVQFVNGMVVFAVVMLVAGSFWWVCHRRWDCP